MKARVLKINSWEVSTILRNDPFLIGVVIYLVGLVLFVYLFLDKQVKETISNQRKNVLLIIADDLRPELGCYVNTNPEYFQDIITPNIDKLAAKSLLLKRAYVQQALCSPSRTSFLTGRRPDTTHVYDLKAYFRDVGGNFTTIPQYFKDYGYTSLGIGKIFHPGKESGRDDRFFSWSKQKRNFHPHNLHHWEDHSHSYRAVPRSEYEDRPLPDMQVADRAVKVLRDLSKSAKPFFLAVGFYKPHLPFVVPERFVNLYSNVSLPRNLYAPRHMPKVAWSQFTELRSYDDVKSLGEINTTLPGTQVKNLRRHYYASVSYIDSLVGLILKELETLGLNDKTIITFLGDHGWQLGEHGEWCKHSNFEVATHAPMMVHIPGLTDKGIVTEKLTEFVDLFPTLVDAAGLPAMQRCPENSSAVKLCTEGSSFLPLISNPKSTKWKTKAFSQYPRPGNIMGYSMRTEQYRYTEWVLFLGKPQYRPDWNVSFGVELYDYKNDPENNWNHAHDPRYQQIQWMLSEQLHAGWRIK